MQANAHFQGAIHQAKAWKSSYESTKASLDEANAKIAVLEAKQVSTSADLEEARAKIVVLTDEKKKGIDAYMLTLDFSDLMREHDAQMRPGIYKEGWDAAVEAITKAHPEAFLADSFPWPLALPGTGASSEGSKEPFLEEDRIIATLDNPAKGRS